MRTMLRELLVFVVLLPVHLYQVVIGPLLPKVCLFYPSCSEYFILAVQKHGLVRGVCKGAWRVCRCNPLSHGGFDPP
jgi:uncharacterized protein